MNMSLFSTKMQEKIVNFKSIENYAFDEINLSFALLTLSKSDSDTSFQVIKPDLTNDSATIDIENLNWQGESCTRLIIRHPQFGNFFTLLPYKNLNLETITKGYKITFDNYSFSVLGESDER